MSTGQNQVKHSLLMVLNYFYPYISGLSEYVRYGGNLMSSEFEVTVLTGKHSDDLPDEEMIDGLRVVRCPPLIRLHRGYISPSFIRKFAQLAAETDVINLHLPMLEAGLFASIGGRYAPIVITYHCDVTPTGGLVDWLAVKSVLLSARLAVKRADSIIVLTKDYASGSPILAGSESKLVEIAPVIKMEECATKSLRSDRSFNIGFVGRFAREKGIDIILDAISPVLERFPNARFLFAGETRHIAGGSIYDSLAERLDRHKTHIELFGRLSNEELWEFYNALDILLLPSINSYEGFGLVQIEAMLAGSLVIASNMRGVRIPVSRTGNGCLVEPGSVGSLVDAISACHALRQERSREQVRAGALQSYSNEAVRKQLGSTLSTLIDRRKQRGMLHADT